MVTKIQTRNQPKNQAVNRRGSAMSPHAKPFTPGTFFAAPTSPTMRANAPIFVPTKAGKNLSNYVGRTSVSTAASTPTFFPQNQSIDASGQYYSITPTLTEPGKNCLVTEDGLVWSVGPWATMKKYKPGAFKQSPAFTVAGVENCRLEVYPNGRDGSNEKGLHVGIVSSDKMQVKFRMSIGTGPVQNKACLGKRLMLAFPPPKEKDNVIINFSVTENLAFQL